MSEYIICEWINHLQLQWFVTLSMKQWYKCVWWPFVSDGKFYQALSR